MDYASGYTASYRAMRVDPASWLDTDPIEGVTGISITRDITGDAPLVDAADMDLDAPVEGECYVRIYLDAEQGGVKESVALGTFILESSGGGTGADSEWSTAELWSVLKPAEDATLPVGETVFAGASCAANAVKLLRRANVDAPVVQGSTSPALAENTVSEEGESHLSLAWALLPEGWSILTDGDGTVSVEPDPMAVAEIDEREIVGTISETWDLSGVPNRMRVTDGAGNEAEAVNDDPDSPTSTVSRGRVIDGDPGDATRASNESLGMFARRALKEQSKVVHTCEYTREFRTDVNLGTHVALPRKDGEWRVVSQSLNCGAGVTVDETAQMEVSTW